MTGAADPMMSFPARTRFAPYSIVRNISDQPIQLTPTLWWMEAGQPRSALSHSITVPAGQTKDLDPISLLAAAGLKNFNGSANLVLDMQGTPGGLLLAAGSVDHKSTYVFEVLPTRVHEGLAKSISYWSIANGDDTMVTLWNPADEAQDFVFTLFFASGHYDFPIHLGPRATNTFNVSEIVHNQVPDAEGNVIPASVHEGSARISGTLGTAQSILVSIDAGTYNVVKATCGQGCETCDGWVIGSFIDTTPVDLAVGATNTVKFIVPFKDGSQRDYTAQSTWGTNNHAIATVQSAGVIKGVSAGSFVTTTTGPSLTPAMPCCNLTGGCCAPPTPPGGSGPGGVVKVQITSADLESNQVHVTLSGPSDTSGTLEVIAIGVNNQPQITYQGGAAIGPGSYTVPLNRPSMPADTYSSVKALWNYYAIPATNTFNLSRNWLVLGLVRHSQYNTPYETACTGSPQAAWTFNSSCTFTQTSLKSDFVSQTFINGTGASQSHGILKYSTSCTDYPSGANSQNSFLAVSSVTGACNTTMSGGVSVATYPSPNVGNPFGCGDNILLVTSSNSNEAVKDAADYCPACSSGFNGTNGHIDDYSSSQACSGSGVGDLGNYWTADTH
jgi:hypothetical protein